MVTIRNCTSLEQSRILSKISSDESADMWYSHHGDPKYNPTTAYEGEQWFSSLIRISHHDVPC